MNRKFKKLAALFLAYLTAVFLCVHPVKLPEKPTPEPGISVCSGDDAPVELPVEPQPPRTH